MAFLITQVSDANITVRRTHFRSKTDNDDSMRAKLMSIGRPNMPIACLIVLLHFCKGSQSTRSLAPRKEVS